jgi:hypothetical protein
MKLLFPAYTPGEFTFRSINKFAFLSPYSRLAFSRVLSLLYTYSLGVSSPRSRKIRAIRVAGATPDLSFLELSSRVCRFGVFEELGYRVYTCVRNAARKNMAGSRGSEANSGQNRIDDRLVTSYLEQGWRVRAREFVP